MGLEHPLYNGQTQVIAWDEGGIFRSQFFFGRVDNIKEVGDLRRKWQMPISYQRWDAS